MTEKRTVRLVVEIPDPGEWCEHKDRNISHDCPLWDHDAAKCRAGMSVREFNEASCGFRYRRPQSCRDAEVPR